MGNRLVFTISAYVLILIASASFTEAYISCNRSTFDDYVSNYCITAYNQSMASTNYLSRCPWPSTRRSYIMLDMCVDNMVRLSGCVEPSIKDELFLEIHRAYFSLCSYKENLDLLTLLLLVLPCIIATLTLPFVGVYITTCRAFVCPSPRFSRARGPTLKATHPLTHITNTPMTPHPPPPEAPSQ